MTTTVRFDATTDWTVPTGVTSIYIEAYGEQGNRSNNYWGGKGGKATGTLGVGPGEVLHIRMDSAGSGDNSAAADVRQGGTTLAKRKIVAGAGGDSAQVQYRGGDGGGLVGAAGSGTNYPAGGGTQAAGGVEGDGGYGSGTPGTLGSGGRGVGGGGNGGDGYYGGGGGGSDYYSGSGGGGSSYIGGVTNGSTTSGVNGTDSAFTSTNRGKPYVTFTYNLNVVTTVVGGVKKSSNASVIVGGVKKPVTSTSVIVGGVKKPATG